MKTCGLCGEDREDVSGTPVAPAGWNGFNNFAEVCAECQQSRKFKMWGKTITAKAAATARVKLDTGSPTPPSEPGKPAVRPAEVQIAHRRTGVLLYTVAHGSLVGAKLVGLTLSGADLQHRGMRGADLHRADLRLANLAGADLRGADLREVNLRGADLRGTDLREARLHRADVGLSLYDDGTRWPVGYDPLAGGATHSVRRW